MRAWLVQDCREDPLVVLVFLSEEKAKAFVDTKNASFDDPYDRMYYYEEVDEVVE